MPIDPNDPAFIDPRVQVLAVAHPKPAAGQAEAEKAETIRRASEKPMDLIWRTLRG